MKLLTKFVLKMGLVILLLQLLLVGIVGLILYLFYQNIRLKFYFEKRGIPYIGAGYSRMYKFLRGTISVPEMEQIFYKEGRDKKAPCVGYADLFVSKAVYITDLDLAKNIFVKDFDHFVNRRKFVSLKGDLLSKRMFPNFDNDEWKSRRGKLSPTFTTGKIRKMFGIFGESSWRMTEYLGKISGKSGGEFNADELFSKCAMDMIASCAFGVDSKVFGEAGKLSEFEVMGKRILFEVKPIIFLRILLVLAAPKIADLFGIEAGDSVPQVYFLRVIKHVMKHRRETGERQEDFLQMMMDIQSGLLKDVDAKEAMEVMMGGKEEEKMAEDKNLTFDDDDIVANCVVFLNAGFDMLHSLPMWVAYALAVHPDIQEKLRKEIRDVAEANGGKLTYELVHGMTYLDLVVNETLRYYTPSTRLERLCNKDYPIPGTNCVIEKGTLITLPVLGVHRDPEYYDEPEKFIPERFLPENKSQRHPYSFRPFGHGPRSCIGMRFALTEAKMLIASLIREFKIEPCGRTEIPPKYSKHVTMKPKDGMWLGIAKF